MFIAKIGKYYYLYYDNPLTGKKTKKTTKSKTKAGAYEFLSKFEANTKPKLENITLSQLKEKMLDYARIHFAPSTVSIYNQSVQRLIKTSGDVFIKHLSQSHIEKYKSQRVLEKVSPSYINIDLRTLKAMFNYAIQWGLLDKNPCQGVKRFSIPEKQRLAFTEEEVKKILTFLPEGYLKNIIIMALNTGCRIDEILNLQWRDVDLNERILTIQNKPNFKTKTGKIRKIPLSDKLFNLLSRIISENREQYIFRKNIGVKFNRDYISKLFKLHLRKLNFPDEFHFHCLRHTFITQLVHKGVNIYDIKELAGHSDIKTTELYMHNVTDDLRRAVNLL